MQAPQFTTLDYRTPGSTEKQLLAAYRRHIVGQERAIRRVVRELLFARAHNGLMRRDDQVAGKFFGFGPTGSGKTLMAEITALLTLGARNAMFKIHCTDFQQSHEIADLLGSPRGYVRTDEEPILTQWTLDEPAFLAQKNNPKLLEEKTLRDRCSELKRNLASITKRLKETAEGSGERQRIETEFRRTDTELQKTRSLHEACLERNGKDPELQDIKGSYDPKNPYFSIMLCDEIEKADPSFIQLLFPILDKAELKLKSKVTAEHGGTTVRFCNTFLFFSSNIGEKRIARLIEGGGIGFRPAKKVSVEKMRELTENKRTEIFHAGYAELRKRLPDAFLGRVGENNIHALAPLTYPDMLDCLNRIMLPEYKERIRRAFPVTLEVTEQAQTFIVNEASDPNKRVLGMRSLNDELKKVEEYLESLTIKSRQEGGLLRGDHVIIDAEGGNGEGGITIKRQENLSRPPASQTEEDHPGENSKAPDAEARPENPRIAIPPLYGIRK